MLENLNKASNILESDISNMYSKDKSVNINRNKVILALLKDLYLAPKIDLHDLIDTKYSNLYDSSYTIYEEYFIRLLLLSKLNIKDKLYEISPELRVRLYSSLCLKHKKKQVLHRINKSKKIAKIVQNSPLLEKVDANYLRDHMTRDPSFELVDRRENHDVTINKVTTKYGGVQIIKAFDNDYKMYEDPFINYMWEDMFNDRKPILLNRESFSLHEDEKKKLGDIILSK